MAEAERPHRSTSINSANNNTTTTTTSTTDLFIRFTSHLSSSSSMRLSSKSILSPARSASLTTSLSRRLRSSRSLKSASASAGSNGGALASPMFGNNGRKRSGSGCENNPEPTSPKVTCIGQVRVKTRKHVKKKMRARSRRKGDTSFRRSADQNDGGGCRFDASENRWVHLPVTICDSLRAFGSELNCFFPCGSSCTDGSNHKDHNGKPPESDRRCCGNGKCCGGGGCCGGGSGGCCGGGSCCAGGSCCGAAFARWFVAVEETGGKRREIELVVGGEDEAEERRRSRRRHVFEGLDFSAIDVKTEKKDRDEEAGRVSICVPPKNALLLMRCRSDPVKAAALKNRVRESQMSQNDDAEVEEAYKDVEEKKDEERSNFEQEMEDKKRIEICEKWISGEPVVDTEVAEAEPLQAEIEEEKGEENDGDDDDEEMKVLEDSVVEAEESRVLEDSCEEELKETFMRKIDDDIRNVLKEEEEHAAETVDFAAEEKKEREDEKENKGIVSVTENEEGTVPGDPEPDPSPEPVKRGSQEERTEKASYKVLPECLLLMMCEPKLSMEISKETWVCSTDFVRWLPERPPLKKKADGDQPKKRTDSNASSRRRSMDKPVMPNQVLLQPPRSSCSYPAAPPAMVTTSAAAEQKAVGTNTAYEPLMLQRCKSEPRRSAAPEACFWKNRKLEPHPPPATLGVGAAGVGF